MNHDDSTQEKILKKLAKKYNLDQRLVKNIVYYPIKFAKEKISDPVNTRPVRIRYFGVFTQKHIVNKNFLFENRVKSLIDNIEDVAVMMGAVLEFPITSLESAKKIINTAFEQKDYEKIELIWDEWSYYRKKV
jgi:nucleoid DNA-binding protein